MSDSFYNERDVEIPLLLEMVKDRNPRTFLDIGAFYSHYYYAQELKNLIPDAIYTGVDILHCEETDKIIDDYIVGNAIDTELGQHDMVACISTIEHAGISTYKENDHMGEGDLLFQALTLAVAPEGSLLLTAPFGLDYFYPDQFVNITEDRLKKWEDIAKVEGFKVEFRFYRNESPATGGAWMECDQDEANKPYDLSKGCQSLVAMIGHKE